MADTTAVSSTNSSSQIRTDYMNLLITQLKNQDPMDPMDNNQMTSQLTQLSQLEQMEGMNTAFQSVLKSSQFSQATSLIGHTVAYQTDSNSPPTTGQVQSVDFSGSEPTLNIGSYQLKLADVLAVG